MNRKEIERAIELITESARQSEVIVENPTVFYTSKNLVEGVKHIKELCQAYEIALSVLRGKIEPVKEKPLTLEQLRDRDGKPVWIVVDNPDEPLTMCALVEVDEDGYIWLTNNLGGKSEYLTMLDDGMRAYDYPLEELVEVKEERDDYRKAFALVCRIIDDYAGLCPQDFFETGCEECNGEAERCGDRPMWECWQRYIKGWVESEFVCRVCGCTDDNACLPGCSWVEPGLCSACVPKEKTEEEGNERDGE